MAPVYEAKRVSVFAGEPLDSLDLTARISRSSRTRRPSPSSIEQRLASQGLAVPNRKGHEFQKFFTTDPLTPSDYLKIQRKLGMNEQLYMMISEHGVAPAASGDFTHYRDHTWPRDAMMSVIALFRSGQHDLAVHTLWSWIELYGSDKHRGRFFDFVTADPEDAFNGFNNPERSPISAAAITPEGRISQERIGWGHNQMESAAWVLGTAYRMANRGYLNLKTEVNDRLNIVDTIMGRENNQRESLLVLMAKFFHAIRYWDQSDLGMWEYRIQKQRGSSIGIVCGALLEVQRFHDKHGWDFFPISYKEDLSRRESAAKFKSQIDEAVEKGLVEFEKRVPRKPGATARECSAPNEEFDSSLLFTGYPFDIVGNRHQLFALLRVAEMNRREIGTIRYPGDDYVAAGYINETNPEMDHFFSDRKKDGFTEAQWTIFDSVAAAMLARYSIVHNDYIAYLQSDRLFKRSLAAINKDRVEYIYDRHPKNHSHQRTEVTIPAGDLTEAYFDDNGILRPNHNSSLAWAISNLLLGYHRCYEASTFFSRS